MSWIWPIVNSYEYDNASWNATEDVEWFEQLYNCRLFNVFAAFYSDVFDLYKVRRAPLCYYLIGGTRYRSWLRHYATSRKIEGSIPVEVIELFNLPNPSSRAMALGSTQPLTEMSTRNIPGR
jgi:hypothetical protein